MAEDTSKTLRFSIEESVWLEKNKKVDEILSMSLEPDISIVENKHYVSVRGALQLNGEYRPFSSDEHTDDEPPLDDHRPLQDQTPIRPIDELSMSGDGVARIKHRFPVDITIPLSRIDNLDDIFVTVESFDYTLPENDCLRLEADVSISGMAEEMVDDETDQDRGVSREAGVETETEDLGVSAEQEGAETSEAVAARENPEEFAAGEKDIHEPFHYEAVKEAEEEEPGQVEKEDAVSGRDSPLVEMKTKQAEPLNTEDTEETAAAGFSVNDERDAEDESDGEEEPVREENALYLTKMLADNEEDSTRLRMCIIQPGESLDTIAERYELPLSQLVRVNQLDNENLEEGQVLYIPVS